MIPKQSQLKKQYGNGGETGGKWWEVLLSNTGDILTGAGNLASGIIGGKEVQNTSYYNAQQNPQKSNIGLYMILGVVSIAVVVGLIMLIRKK
ncbi:MAG: hypothetical protein LBI45_07255 [Bacteroidales bacterium]|jgi:hypothetical protein|nr:hypothetical protein [Bacteroidales bacterium]